MAVTRRRTGQAPVSAAERVTAKSGARRVPVDGRHFRPTAPTGDVDRLAPLVVGIARRPH